MLTLKIELSLPSWILIPSATVRKLFGLQRLQSFALLFHFSLAYQLTLAKPPNLCLGAEFRAKSKAEVILAVVRVFAFRIAQLKHKLLDCYFVTGVELELGRKGA